MLDNIAPKVRQGGFLFAGEGLSERACRLFSLLSVCVCLCLCVLFLFPCFSHLTCCVFNQLLMPQPAFGTSLGLVKLARFPLLSVPHFLLSHQCTSPQPQLSLRPCLDCTTLSKNTTPTPPTPHVISNKLTKLLPSNAHIHTIHH